MTLAFRGFRRSWNKTFLTSLGLIFAAEVVTFVTAWFFLDLNTNHWIDDKVAQVIQISQRVAANGNWSQIDRVHGIDSDSALFKQYYKSIVDLSRRNFQKAGSVFLVDVQHGEEFDIDNGDNDVVDNGKANDWELRAYASHKTTHTPVPFSDDSGTYLAAFVPIVRNSNVIGLVAAEFDTAPLSDFRQIVRGAFAWSMLPAIILSLAISFALAGRFVEPMDVLREIEDVRSQSSAQTDGVNAIWEQLTDRQRQVFELLGQGLKNQEIADRLVVDVETVKSHLKNIRERTGGMSRLQLAIAARGLLPR